MSSALLCAMQRIAHSLLEVDVNEILGKGRVLSAENGLVGQHAQVGTRKSHPLKCRFFTIFRLEKQKVRTSLIQSTEVLSQKYGCFASRSPMFWDFRRAHFACFLPFSSQFSGVSGENGAEKLCRCPENPSEISVFGPQDSEMRAGTRAKLCQNNLRFQSGNSAETLQQTGVMAAI